MMFYLKEWPNRSATLMSEDGVVLWTFPTLEEARRVWRDWYSVQEDRVHYHIGYLREPGASECEPA
jgi:hypothetical protein